MNESNSLANWSLEKQMIRTKIRENKGKKKPNAFRKLRSRLLAHLSSLLNLKLMKITSVKRSGVGLLRMYSIWMRKWRQYLNEQQIELQEKKQREIKLDRQLRLLRKRLILHRRFIRRRYQNIPSKQSPEQNSTTDKVSRRLIGYQKRASRSSTIEEEFSRRLRSQPTSKTSSAELFIQFSDILEFIPQSAVPKNKTESVKGKKLDLEVRPEISFLSARERKINAYLKSIQKHIAANIGTRKKSIKPSSSGIQKSITPHSTSSHMSVRKVSSENMKRRHTKFKGLDQGSNHVAPAESQLHLHEVSEGDYDEFSRRSTTSVAVPSQKKLKTLHRKLYQAIVMQKKRSCGEELMQDMRTSKFRPIQELLKDVMEGYCMLDIIADRDGILRIVRKHYMWKNLASVYNDLTSVGVAAKDVIKVLKDQYFRNIEEIFDEAVENGMALIDEKPDTMHVENRVSLNMADNTDSDMALMDSLRYNKPLSSRETILTLGMPERQSILSMQLKSYRDISVVEDRYSMENLKKIERAHVLYFASLKKSPLQIQLEQQKSAMAKESQILSRSQSGTKKKKKKRKQKQQQQKIDSNRLYYEPRKTCRERSILDVDDLKDCHCVGHNRISKCTRCGVELPSLSCTENLGNSSSSLSLYSIAACGKNKELLRPASDICDQCGFVHQQRSPCPTLIQTSTSKTLQHLCPINGIATHPEGSSSMRVETCLPRICC
ncbi:hypothetical protein KR044_004856 [Drosophila immigrans]|nr:hypothetical protein KR044_004856 [Drosophila immigrans]